MVNVQVRGEMSPERRAALSFTGAGNISETEQTGKIEISLTLRDALILELTTQQWNNDLPPDIRERAGTAADFLAKYVQTVTPSEVLPLTAMREGFALVSLRTHPERRPLNSLHGRRLSRPVPQCAGIYGAQCVRGW